MRIIIHVSNIRGNLQMYGGSFLTEAVAYKIDYTIDGVREGDIFIQLGTSLIFSAGRGCDNTCRVIVGSFLPTHISKASHSQLTQMSNRRELR